MTIAWALMDRILNHVSSPLTVSLDTKKLCEQVIATCNDQTQQRDFDNRFAKIVDRLVGETKKTTAFSFEEGASIMQVMKMLLWAMLDHTKSSGRPFSRLVRSQCTQVEPLLRTISAARND